MEEKCFCHFNGYEVKDAKARYDIELIKKTSVTPEMFGAEADGLTDDTEAIQRAINSGNPVHLPSGKKYLISEEIKIISNTKIIFDADLYVGGYRGSWFAFYDKEQEQPGYSGVHDVCISGSGNLYCNGDNQPDFLMCPFRVYHAKNIEISGISIHNYSKHHAIEVGGCDGVLIDGVKFYGMFLNGEIGAGEAIQIERISEGGTNAAIPYDGTLPKNITIKNCYFGPSNEGGKIYTAIGVHDQVNDPTKETMFENITIENNIFDGIAFNSVLNRSLTGNPVMCCIGFDSNIKNISIKGNKFKECQQSAICIGNYSDNVVISGNIMERTRAVDINVMTGCSNVIIEKNVFSDFATINTETQDDDGMPCIYLQEAENVKIKDNIFTSEFANMPIHIAGAHVNGAKNLDVRDNILDCPLQWDNYIRYRNASKNFMIVNNESGVYSGTFETAKDNHLFDKFVVGYQIGGKSTSKILSEPSMFTFAGFISDFYNGKFYTVDIDFNRYNISIHGNKRYDFSGNVVDYSEGDTDFIKILYVYGLKSSNNTRTE